jgi:hypothetical protein
VGYTALDIVVVIAYIGFCLLCGYIGSRFCRRKNRDSFKGWLIGLIMGLPGLAIAALLRPRPPEVMRTVQCPHCHTNQDVPVAITLLDCKQCEEEITLAPPTPQEMAQIISASRDATTPKRPSS